MVKIPSSFLFLLASYPAMAWTPPEKPDPHQILSEARDDRRAGRFEDALRKHLWFQRESLKYEPALVGVRGSFAMADWAQLGRKYAPAMQALLRERSERAADVAAGRDVLASFGDVAAIDRALDDWNETYRLFALIEGRDEALALRASRYAHEAFVEMKDFAKAARYLDPEAELRMVMDMRKSLGRMGGEQYPGQDAMAERLLNERLGQMVAVLVLGGRTADARSLAERMRKEIGGAKLDETLARALEGQLPPPFITREQRARMNEMMP